VVGTHSRTVSSSAKSPEHADSNDNRLYDIITMGRRGKKHGQKFLHDRWEGWK